jgi:hypothetical protein
LGTEEKIEEEGSYLFEMPRYKLPRDDLSIGIETEQPSTLFITLLK